MDADLLGRRNRLDVKFGKACPRTETADSMSAGDYPKSYGEVKQARSRQEGARKKAVREKGRPLIT